MSGCSEFLLLFIRLQEKCPEFLAGNEESVKNEEEVGRQKKKMLLHKTSSIFLRNVAPNITMEEIETVPFLSVCSEVCETNVMV